MAAAARPKAADCAVRLWDQPTGRPGETIHLLARGGVGDGATIHHKTVGHTGACRQISVEDAPVILTKRHPVAVQDQTHLLGIRRPKCKAPLAVGDGALPQ